MLHSIPWLTFIKVVFVIAALYYAGILILYYRSELGRWAKRLFFLGMGLVLQQVVHAQTADGNNGINQANTMVRSYFEAGTQLLYAVGAIMGLIGAVKVYNSMTRHDNQASQHAAVWFGACIFLVISATVLKSFYGIN